MTCSNKMYFKPLIFMVDSASEIYLFLSKSTNVMQLIVLT